MRLAGEADGEANRGAVADDVDVVEPPLRHEDEVARAGLDTLRLALDLPVDLTLQHHPPLVLDVIVAVVGVTRRLADQGTDDVVGEGHANAPRGRPLLPLDLFQARVQSL